MTYQEAIEVAKEGLAHAGDLYTGYQDIRDFLNLSIEALEKQIAKKIETLFDNGCLNAFCPSCKGGLGLAIRSDKYSYCRHCGQSLDWGDTE